MSNCVQIIQQTLANGAIPATLTGAGANPSITLPLGTAPGQKARQGEVMGQSDGNPDSADPTVGSTRNAVLTISNYTVNMDIDRLYAQPRSEERRVGKEGRTRSVRGAANGGIEHDYGLDCLDNSKVGGMEQPP